MTANLGPQMCILDCGLSRQSIAVFHRPRNNVSDAGVRGALNGVSIIEEGTSENQTTIAFKKVNERNLER